MGDIKIRTGPNGWTMVAVEDIVPYPRNAKTHPPDQVERLRHSLDMFGFVRPLLINERMELLAGHGMLLAARASGMEQVPVQVVHGLTRAQERAYIHADNKLSELASWDLGVLDSELRELEGLGVDMGDLGFDLDVSGTQSDALDLEDDQAQPDDRPQVHCPKCGFVFEA